MKQIHFNLELMVGGFIIILATSVGLTFFEFQEGDMTPDVILFFVFMLVAYVNWLNADK